VKAFSEYPVNVNDLIGPLPRGVIEHAVGIATRHVVGQAERERGKDATIQALSSLRIEVDTSQISPSTNRIGNVVFRVTMEVA
jgi:hypothetical protein